MINLDVQNGNARLAVIPYLPGFYQKGILKRTPLWTYSSKRISNVTNISSKNKVKQVLTRFLEFLGYQFL